MTEFDIIKQYFAMQVEHRPDVILGIGDDAAIVQPPSGCELAITTDTLVAGVHFSTTTSAFNIGYKALAVNLSDLAAMGATPAWITLALTLPEANEPWLQGFCDGFFTLANRYRATLIGGDLTQGPLSITVQAIGWIPPHQALLRSKAKPDDLIYVSGTLGDAGLALQCLQSPSSLGPVYERDILERLNRPEPRVLTGEQLRNVASAAIDISDGLAADLNHILKASQVGARVYVDKLPFSTALSHLITPEAAIALALTSGDDYELCFTVPVEKRAELEKRLGTLACRYTCIGEITQQNGLILLYQNGNTYDGSTSGYQHF